MADEKKKKGKYGLTQEELAGLEPFQLRLLKSNAEKYGAKVPASTPAAEMPSDEGTFTGWVKQLPSAIGKSLKEGWDYWTSSPYRALEAPAQALETIAWPVTKAAELQPFSEDLQQAGTAIKDKLHSKSVKYGNLAGGYEPSGALSVLGSLKWPWPGPKPIKSEKFIPTKAELGTLGKETAKGAATGGTYGVMAETDKPSAERDYLKAGLEWAAMGGAGHAGAGVFGARGEKKPAPPAPAAQHGVVLPDFPPGDAPKLDLPKTPTDPNWKLEPSSVPAPPFMGVTDDLMKQEPVFPPPSRVMHGDGNTPTEPTLPPGQQQRAALDFGLPPTDVPLGEAPSPVTHKDFMGSKVPYLNPDELTQVPLQAGSKPTEPILGQPVDYLPPESMPHEPIGDGRPPEFMGQPVENVPLEALPKGSGAPNFMGETVDFMPPEQLPHPASSVPDSAFNGDLEDRLNSVFLSDYHDGSAISLHGQGFTPNEIAALERAGLATGGTMSRQQWGKWMDERSNRLTGKRAPSKQPESFDLLGQHVNKLEETIPLTERVPDALHPLSSAMPEDVLDVPEVTVRADRLPEVNNPPTRSLQPPSPEELQRMLSQGRPQPMPPPVQDLLAEAMPGMKPIKDYLELGPIKQGIREQAGLPGMPPPEIGAKPNIAREVTPEEAPLFSQQAQTPEPEQMPMLEVPHSQYGDIHPPDPGVSFKDPLDYSSFEIAAIPRHNLPPELQDDLLARTAYARDTMGIAGDERGFSIPIEGQGMGGTAERHASSASPTFPWYKEVTTDGGLKPKDVENALRKIEQDQGLDKGKYVERVKEALLKDREFTGWKRAGEVSDEPIPHEGHEPLHDPGAEYEPTWEDMDQLADDAGVRQEIHDEVDVDRSMMQRLSDTLNNEKGAVTLGSGVGPLERTLLTVRRFAERHPEFEPVYQMSLDEGQMATATAYDLRKTAEPYFKLTEQDRAIVDKILRDRRRLGRSVPIPQQFQPAVQSIDNMMASAYQFINDVRETKGLQPIAQDQFYVPFSRSGDYLVVLNGPAGTTPKWVSAVGTLREAEALSRQLEQRFPGSTTNVKYGSGKKGDQPGLDFATLQQIENAGFITRDEYEEIIKQFDLPPGYAEHFRQAGKVMGEAESLLNPIERYIQATSAYGARFIYDEPMKANISKLKDPQVRQYAEAYRDYLRKKPVEYSRLRGSVAVWDLALNVGSMAQNASQVPVLGFPMLQRAVGGDIKQATKIFKEGFSALLRPTPDDLRFLAMAEREGHTRPVNAEELFGTQGIDQTGVEFGAPAIQRQAERGAISPNTARMLRKPVDMLAAGVEKTYDVGQRVNRDLGQRTSYALNRLLGHSQPIAKDISEKAHPILMAGFASIEEANRKWAILAGMRAGRLQGLSEPEAYEFAKKFSRDVNFDYSPSSRSPLYRGAGAPLGLFATFGTEALSTYSKLIREQLKKPGMGKFAGGAAGTALAAYWTMAGIKGLPGVEDFDVHGPWPGALSETLPDWAYQGPASAATGLDIASKFKIGPRLPIDMQNGGLDLSQVAVAQPFQNVAMGADWFLHSPMDAPSAQLAGERVLPPSLRAAATAGRWAGLGPEGSIEHGAVGTLRGHTPGPNAQGEKDFFHPSMKDVALKALGFTPLELSKQYARGRIEQVKDDRLKAGVTSLVNGAANDLDRNGESAPSRNLAKLREQNPQAYRELMKAWAKRKGGEQASTREIYRRAQEPKPIAKRKQHGNQG
jgi:hypothetical protein